MACSIPDMSCLDHRHGHTMRLRAHPKVSCVQSKDQRQYQKTAQRRGKFKNGAAS